MYPCRSQSTEILSNASDDIATEALDFATQAGLDIYIASLESDMRESAKNDFEKPPNFTTKSKTPAAKSSCSADRCAVQSTGTLKCIALLAFQESIWAAFENAANALADDSRILK